MALRIKQTGQRLSGATPKDGIGEYHAATARLAVCNCGGKTIDQKHCFPGDPVPVTHRKHRSVAASAVV